MLGNKSVNELKQWISDYMYADEHGNTVVNTLLLLDQIDYLEKKH